MKPLKLRMKAICPGDQQTTNPQQTMIDVTVAFRPALTIWALGVT